MVVALLDLPPEILLSIISHLNFDFFATDIGRLTLSQKWFNLALTSLRTVRLKPASLRLPWARAILNLLPPSLASLTLKLQRDDARTASPINTTRTALDILAKTLLPKCRKLQRLDIAMAYLWDAPPVIHTLHALVAYAPENLTTLDIDTWGGIWSKPSPGRHLCEVINKMMLFCSLQTLRCRMVATCERLLALPEGLGEGEMIANSKLKKVIVSVAWCSFSSGGAIYRKCRHVPCRGMRFARACHDEELSPNETLDGVIRQQVVRFAERIQRPEVVRLWTFKETRDGVKSLALDAVERK